ncbi:MAG: hypothetical protein RL621_503 [Bacteroidota bacterium]|jgi:hypothetical protein
MKLRSSPKKVLVFILIIFFPFFGLSQVQDLAIPFQGIAKDYFGTIVNQRSIYIEIAIVTKEQPLAILYNELHKAKTDEWGLFSVQIGKGKWMGGSKSKLSFIDWSSGNHQLSFKMAIEPEAPLPTWDYTQHLIPMGSSAFGVVPYALYSFGNNNSGSFSNDQLKQKLNISDTVSMLSAYAKLSSILSLQDQVQSKLAISDTAQMLANYASKKQLQDFMAIKDSINTYVTPFQLVNIHLDVNQKINIADSVNGYITPSKLRTAIIDTSSLSNRINTKFNLSDTIYMSQRIALRELQANKSINLNALSDYNDNMYPSVKATKDYIDNQVSNGAPDATINNKGILQLTGDLTGSSADPRIANNAITTNKVADATITDAKIATGIQAAKVGLANVSNHAQVYSFNGLTAQVQGLATPGNSGLAPNWSSVGSDHTLNIPMASASSVTAGLISKVDYDQFNTAYANRINTLTTNGNSGASVLIGQSLNIPHYTLAGLSGNVTPNYLLAGPANGAAGAAQFRALVATDIPNNTASTTGNAATASALATAVSINNVSFDGTANITLKASTTNKLFFSAAGMGAMPTENFDGAAAKTISYNTIGAAPQMGSTNITTLGTIGTGVWNGAVIGESYGGSGSVSGILKADGNGLVSAANTSDYQTPLTFSSPLTNVSSNISMSQVSSSTSGYLSSADWNTFNNKLSSTEKAVANGLATLDASGKIPTSQVPAISFSSGYVVNNQTQMLALSSAVVGSIAIRTDNSKNYVLSASDPSVLSNWLELLMPASVSSVNGYTTGSITLTSSDIAEGSNLYFTNARVRTAVDAFLTGEAPLSYNVSNGKMGIAQSGTNSNGYLSSTDWNTFNNKLSSFSNQTANTFYAAPNGTTGVPSFRTLVAADIPTLNQNTTGNAATADAFVNTRNINGVGFNGTADITISANTPNAISFNSSGTGTNTPTSFNGSNSVTISYNSIGASPLVGSTSLTTLGTISAGTWNGNIIGSIYGGAGTNNGILRANGLGVVSVAIAGTDFESPLSFTAPLSRTSNTVSIETATSSNSGMLSSSDWQTFNNKQASMVAGTGVSISGGNTINIGQAIANTNSPSFAGITLSSLNVSGIVANTAAGVLSTVSTTGTGLVVKENTPTLITPNIGAATASSINATGDITAKRYKLTMPTATSAAATTNIDLSTGNVFTINLGANITSLTTTNAAVGTYLIKFVQDATGSRTVSFPGTWKWAGGIAPTLTSSASKLDIVTLVYDGTIFYATIVKNF